jgi:nicotinamide-nucleotide adenylyltransferase
VNSDTGDRLSALDGTETPSAVRFDDGPSFAGGLVVLPSAFNPPTLAHQHLLERALTPGPSFDVTGEGGLGHGEENRRRPVALLTTRNVDKGVHGATLEQRVEMLLALGQEWPLLAVVASNQARIIDQAESLRAAFGKDLDLTFVVGFDTLERLFAERYYSDMEAELAPFFGHSRVLAANRADIGPRQVSTWIERHAGPFANWIDVIEIDEGPASMSSTKAREAVAEGAGDMLPASVERYIRKHALYR